MKAELLYKILIAISLAIMLNRCRTIPAYADPSGPVYMQNNYTDYRVTKELYTVVSFNIEQCKEVALALKELQSDVYYAQADILLLQEMDDTSVIKIAETLQMNSLYYPISVNRHTGNKWGNAILSKYPISRPDKLILPHTKYNGRIRNATNAIVTIGDTEVLVYSIHNETIPMRQSKRYDQMDAIVHDIKDKINTADAVIVGGDFNTTLGKDRRELDEKFSKIQMTRVTDELGPTSRALFGLIKPHNDHIYVRTIQVKKVDKMEDSKASDHLPILLTFSLIK